jgi:F-type H+-transporting ATPase subunit delta
MSDNTTAARPYARAVFEKAQADSALQSWSEALQLLTEVVAHQDMVRVLALPDMGATDKGQLLIDICGDRLNDGKVNFVKLLAENGRLILLADIRDLYEEFRAEAESKIEATVISAYPLSDTQQQAITAALKTKLGCDVSLLTQTDATLIGGVIIRAGDLVIDGSTRASLASLATALSH